MKRTNGGDDAHRQVIRSANTSEASRGSWFFAVVSSCLVSVPLVLVAITHAEYVALANESVGYRYFACARIWGGDRQQVWLPQGQLLTSIQHAIWWSLNLFGVHDLRTRLQAFGLGTTGVITFCGVALLVLVTRIKQFSAADRLLIALATLGPIFFFRMGLYYSTSADYYHLNIILGGVSLAVFIHELRSAEPAPWKVGMVCGMLLSNKVTLLALALLCAGPVLLRPATLRVVITRIIGLTTGAIAAAVCVFWIFHGFDVLAMTKSLPKWIGVMSSMGAQENFWSQLPAAVIHYGYILGATWWIIVLIAVSCFLSLRHNRVELRRWLLLLLAALTPCLAITGLVKRPSNTTLFDIVIIMLVSSAAMLAVAKEFSQRASPLFVVVWLIWGLSQAWAGVPQEIADLKRSFITGQEAWAMHRDLDSRQEHVTLVVPDNTYTWPGIEIAALKGLATFPTWNIDSGAGPLLEETLPKTTFLISGTQARIQPGLLVWRDIGDPNRPSLSRTDELLAFLVQRSHCEAYYLNLTRCEVRSPSDYQTVSERHPATVEISLFLEGIRSLGVVNGWRRQNMYGGDAYVSVGGDQVVLHYPSVPQNVCRSVMLQMDGLVKAIGVEGHSPDWRRQVTPGIAAKDCAAPVDQLNFWAK